MKIDKLKEQARRHEQGEEWSKALDFYLQAIEATEASDEPDISLFNRVGDLQVRVGDKDGAVATYERAIDLYVEAELPNNAIAICQKIIRNIPGKGAPFLKMGQIKARQGFVVDARQNFLTYAEMKQSRGDTEEAFRALKEFVSLIPGDVETRLFLAEQLVAKEAIEDALAHFDMAHRHLVRDGDDDGAAQLRARVAELDPEVTLSSEPPAEEEAAPLQGGLVGFETTAMGHDDLRFDDPVETEPLPAELEEALAEEAGSAESDFADISVGGDGDDGAEEGTMESTASFDEAFGEIGLGESEEEVADEADEDEADEDFGELPGFDDEDEPAAVAEESDFAEIGGDDEPLPGFDGLDSEEVDEEEAEPLPGLEGLGMEGEEEDEGLEEPDELILSDFDSDEADDEESPAPEETMEIAFEEASFGEEEEEPAEEAPPAPAEPPAAPPAATGDSFVDLGSMVLDPKEEKTTRWKVHTDGPSGDEQADFAKMLSQFKEKVAENLDTGDFTARYDLGAAYKEMGLLDEAIGEFQAALRAHPKGLAALEMLGQCFLEKGEPQAAIRTLQRALAIPTEVEDDLLGIYYYLAQCYEATGEESQALEYYEKIFALDINFRDVTERLRVLR
jgi:tetratricopeptide (TPR) repeat protein